MIPYDFDRASHELDELVTAQELTEAEVFVFLEVKGRHAVAPLNQHVVEVELPDEVAHASEFELLHLNHVDQYDSLRQISLLSTHLERQVEQVCVQVKAAIVE